MKNAFKVKLKLLRYLLFLSAVSCPALSMGADYSLREWTRDTRTVDTKILRPLAEQFQTLPCDTPLDSYITTFFNELAKVRELISPQSYLLFREIAIAIRTEFYPLNGHISCKTIDRWSLIELNIKAKSEMIANTLVITDLNPK